jgi:hypothetical protein
MLSCPWSIWDSFRCLYSNTPKRSFGWITIKIHNKINYLKVPTYDRYHERRATGRKVASPAVVLRGAVRLVACAATRIRPFPSEELAPDTVSAWQELRHALETRRHQRTQRRRFRRDPATYLGKLEAKFLQLSLPP